MSFISIRLPILSAHPGGVYGGTQILEHRYAQIASQMIARIHVESMVRSVFGALVDSLGGARYILHTLLTLRGNIAALPHTWLTTTAPSVGRLALESSAQWAATIRSGIGLSRLVTAICTAINTVVIFGSTLGANHASTTATQDQQPIDDGKPGNSPSPNFLVHVRSPH